MAETFNLKFSDPESRDLPIGEKVNRLFTLDGIILPLVLTDLLPNMVFYDSVKGLSYLRKPIHSSGLRPKVDRSTIVLQISGTVKEDDQGNLESAFSTFYGPNSKYNLRGGEPSWNTETLERAYMMAMTNAFEFFVPQLLYIHPNIRDVVVLIPSQRLVTNMNDNIWDWLRHGFPDAACLPEGTYEAEYKALHQYFRKIEQEGKSVQMWAVNRNEVTGANMLVAEALVMMRNPIFKKEAEEHMLRSHVEMMAKNVAGCRMETISAKVEEEDGARWNPKH